MSVWELEPVGQLAPGPAYTPAAREAPLLVVYARALRRFRLWIAMAAVTGAGLGWLLPAMAEPRWEALTMLEAAAPNDRFLALDEVDPSAEQAASFRTRLRTQVRLLESRAVAEQAVDRLSAAEPERAGQWRQAADQLSVSAMDDSRIIELRTQAAAARAAEEFLETHLAVYLEQADERRQSGALATEEWFGSRLSEIEGRLRDSELALQEAARLATLIPASPERRSAAEADLRRLEERLGESRSQALGLRAQIDSGAGAGAAISEDPLASRRRELDALIRRRAELAAIYTPEHHALKQVEAEAAAVQASLQSASERLDGALRNSLTEAERRIALFEQERDRRLELLSEAAAAAVRFDILERQVAANRDLYQTFLEARRKAAVAVLSPAPSLRVVDPPAAGDAPVGPNPPLGALAGLLTGLGLAFGAALIRERLDQTFRLPGDLGLVLPTRELAAIPDARCEAAPKRLTSATGPMIPLDWRPELAARRAGGSFVAESFRSMRTSLLHAAGRGAGEGHVWTVTSPSAGDGKTTIAANLALSMAELGRSVLLVDADLRRPRLHRIFEAGNRSGLSDLLAAEPPLDADIEGAIQAMPGSERLRLLPSGVAPFGGQGLLHSSALDALLRRMRQRFDLVIIDAPPALEISDARALACSADGTVLVVRAGRTGTALAREADALLRADGARVLGAVLNSWDPREGGRRGYGAYVRGPRAA